MTDDATLLETLLEQERRLVFDRFDNDTAIALGQKILERARANRQQIVVDISRGDQRLFYAALAGTSADNEYWVAGKIAGGEALRPLLLLCRPEGAPEGCRFRRWRAGHRTTFRAHGGAFPIIVAGVGGVVGTATVSGLPQAEDHALVVAVIEEFLAETGMGGGRPEVWTA